MTQFGDHNLGEMLLNFKALKDKLREVKGVLNIWKDQGLSTKERYEIESIFSGGNSQISQLYASIEREKGILGGIFEQEQQMIASLD